MPDSRVRRSTRISRVAPLLLGLAAMALASGCVYGSGHSGRHGGYSGYGTGGSYGRSYDPYYRSRAYGPIHRGSPSYYCRDCGYDRDRHRKDDRPDPLARRQKEEWRDLRHDQNDQWRDLRRQQELERRRLQQAGEWDGEDKQRQVERAREVRSQQRGERHEVKDEQRDERQHRQGGRHR